MKIKFNHDIVVYFINNSMTFNIDKEYIELIKIVNDDTFDFLKFTKDTVVRYVSPRINFLWRVLILTIKYPQVELYLKNLLNYFTSDELNKIKINNLYILPRMCFLAHEISLNAFEIMLNYGVDINIKSEYNNNNTAVHMLFSNPCDSHIYNVLNLLIKYNVNLNAIKYDYKLTVLDKLTRYEIKLDEETKNCIMLLIDFGARTNNPKQNNEIYDFIEYYKYSTIKRAIKNENTI